MQIAGHLETIVIRQRGLKQKQDQGTPDERLKIGCGKK